MKQAVILIIAIISILSMSCSKKNTDMTILTENYPPLSFLEDGVVTGYGAEVVAAIQAELKTSAAPQVLAWDEAYNRALSEANVVLFTMEKTPEREALFNFIGPLGDNTAYFYALASNPIELADLEAAKTAGNITTTTNWFTEQFLKEQGFTNLLSKADPSDNLRMLMSKEADLGVFTDVTFPQLCEEAGVVADSLRPVLQIMQSQYYIAISKATAPEIVKQWETAFSTIQQNGTLENIHSKWFPAAE